MRKTLFLLVFVYCSSFVNAQSQSIGLNFSYFSHNIFNTHWLNAPDLGVSYNLFFNKQHGVVTGLSINRFKRGFDFTTSDGVLLFIEQKDYNANYSLHYIFKYKQWFAKGGLNLAAFNIYTSTYLDDELSTKSFLESG